MPILSVDCVSRRLSDIFASPHAKTTGHPPIRISVSLSAENRAQRPFLHSRAMGPTSEASPVEECAKRLISADPALQTARKSERRGLSIVLVPEVGVRSRRCLRSQRACLIPSLQPRLLWKVLYATRGWSRRTTRMVFWPRKHRFSGLGDIEPCVPRCEVGMGGMRLSKKGNYKGLTKMGEARGRCSKWAVENSISKLRPQVNTLWLQELIRHWYTDRSFVVVEADQKTVRARGRWTSADISILNECQHGRCCDSQNSWNLQGRAGRSGEGRR